MSKSCTFFGHSDCPYDIKNKLKTEILNLIINHNVRTFYVGNQGHFDRMVYSVLNEVSNEYHFINYCIVLAYMPNENDEYIQNKNTLLPEEIENVPKRFAISFRNEWMINRSDFLICYVTHITGGAYKYTEKSRKKGLQIIEL